MASPNKRRDLDLTKLLMSDYKVETIDDRVDEFFVFFHGPSDSLYKGGEWKVSVYLPNEYPFKHPQILFVNKIYHPNIDEKTGAVCLDVIRETWSPMFDLVNVFELFLPQLLMYPNASDPLNEDAGALMTSNPNAYEQKVKEYCERYAKPEGVGAESEEVPTDDESSSSEHDSSTEAKVGPDDP